MTIHSKKNKASRWHHCQLKPETTCIGQ